MLPISRPILFQFLLRQEAMYLESASRNCDRLFGNMEYGRSRLGGFQVRSWKSCNDCTVHFKLLGINKVKSLGGIPGLTIGHKCNLVTAQAVTWSLVPAACACIVRPATCGTAVILSVVMERSRSGIHWYLHTNFLSPQSGEAVSPQRALAVTPSP